MHRVANHINEVMGTSCIAAIWGLSLAEIDLLAKIVCTVAVSAATVYGVLRRPKK